MQAILALSQADSVRWLAVLLDAAAKGLVLLAVAAGATLLLRRGSAAVRHMVWTLAVVGLLCVPILSVALPQWQVALLPAWTGASEPVPAQPPAPAVAAQPAAFAPTPAGGSPAESPAAPTEGAAAKAAPWVPSEPSSAVSPQQAVAPQEAGLPAPATIAAVNPAPPRHWSAWALLVWAAGSALMTAPLLLGTVLVWWQTRRARPVADKEWTSLLASLAARLGVRRTVSLRRSGGSSIPATCGILRPAIVLPAEASDWSPQRRAVVLLHELAHVKRADCLTQLIARLARVLYWFNPLVWLAGRMLRIERERACDDLVLAAGHKASDYASHLLAIVRTLRSPRCPSLAAVAMARRSQFEGRMLAILDGRRNRRALTKLGLLLAAVLVVGVVVPLSILRATAADEPAAKDANAMATLPAAREQPGHALTGMALDEAGRPVAGAEVLVLQFGPHYAGYGYPLEQKILGRAQSGPDGMFSVAVTRGIEEASLTAIARKPDVGFGFSSTIALPARDGNTRAIRLHKAGQMEGVIVDEAGQPVAGAEVRADLFLDEQSFDPDVLGCPDLDWFAVRTGKDGRFAISGVPTGMRAELVVRAAGCGTVSTRERENKAPQFAPGRQDIRIVLPRQCRIEGVVIDKDAGKPVGDVQLIAAETATADDLRLGRPTTPPVLIRSAKDGNFAMEGLKPGRWMVAPAQHGMIERFGPAPWLAQPAVVDLAAGKIQSIRLELSRGELVEATLATAARGAPVKGRLGIFGKESMREFWGSQVSDDKGIVRMRLLPGRYTLFASDYPDPVVLPRPTGAKPAPGAPGPDRGTRQESAGSGAHGK